MRIFLFCLLLGSLVTSVQAEPSSTAGTLFTSTLMDANGKSVDLSIYRGKPLVVNFWARWCAPCREEIPELNRLNQQYRGKLEILGIGLEDDIDEVRRFRQKTPMKYPVFLAGDQAINLMKSLGNTRGGLPYTVYIDRDGRIIQTKLGKLQRADLEAGAQSILK